MCIKLNDKYLKLYIIFAISCCIIVIISISATGYICGEYNNCIAFYITFTIVFGLPVITSIVLLVMAMFLVIIFYCRNEYNIDNKDEYEQLL